MADQDYRAIADQLAADIAAGRLAPGTRLLPQREFAYQRGIAASTAGRVYADLRRRGLVTGEVGRGTYVRPPLGRLNTVLGEPNDAPVDLAINFPILPDQAALLQHTLGATLRAEVLAHAMKPVGTAATPEARAIAASFLARAAWSPSPSQLLFAGNGRQAIAAAMAALASSGGRIGVEALTYPIAKSIAARLGITLVPIELDEHGVRPEGILRAHKRTPLNGLYLQPHLHNPLGVSMDRARRREIASVLEKTGLVAIEDAIYAFLTDAPPLAATAPDHTILVDSLSKRIAPGATLGMIAAPARLADRVAGALRAGGGTAMGLALFVSLRSMSDGTAARLAEAKRKDAIERQAIAREALEGLAIKGDRRAYHLWLDLPESWNGEAFVSAAARQGIALTAGSAFAVAPGHAPRSVRIALAAPPKDVLARALIALRSLALSDPGDSATE
ncbi:MAG: PLP-dependent aminotransferase family protein [Alphaproteobacteria bacterium]